ncbi:MAG: deoxyribodipyrimidine photo-lyase [Parvularculaceae bacterium]|nr:deoxyribodipyrimidine photo-lyase [Parvularculaceae bacterium]
MPYAPAIMWFRRDLRIADNPALCAALASGKPVIGFYALDEGTFLAPGGAQRWFLHHALAGLKKSLGALGVPLILDPGKGGDHLLRLAIDAKASAVFWNRRYAASEIEEDKRIKADLAGAGIRAESFNGSLLREPWEVKTKTGGPYRVYTPFWNAVRALGPARSVCAAPHQKAPAALKTASSALEDLDLLPTQPNWAGEFGDFWSPSENGAQAALDAFLAEPARTYGEHRNRPDMTGTSRLSPHLAVGTISPIQVWNAATAAIEARQIPDTEGWKFLSEIVWREFSYHLLYYHPAMATTPLRPEFAGFPWRDDAAALKAWTRGQTGIPIVDAGMRELWRTGWMHNRVRMIAASFLIKNLLIHWREGERWFWDTLVDADPANNAASWQWVAGSGADAAPYFRIFNPVTQGEKFDPDGAYVRRFVPELAGLPPETIHQPWTASEKALDRAGIKLGSTYPKPIADLAETRKRALAAYDEMRSGASD